MTTNSGLTDYQDECLTILLEECGETTQEICKIFRFGAVEESHHTTNATHIEKLEQELGDLLAMIEMVRDSQIGITDRGLEIAKEKKRAKVVKWMKFHKEEKASPTEPVIADYARPNIAYMNDMHEGYDYYGPEVNF